MMVQEIQPVETAGIRANGHLSIRCRAILLCVILTGLFFRFYEIDRQVYWNDEVYTSLRTSGYRLVEIEKELRDKEVIQVADMNKYQQLAANKTVVDTVGGLIDEEPQVAPFYFVLTRLWVRCFGSSTKAFRVLSAVFSVLTIPLLLWLCYEVFGSMDVSLVATALVSVSPAQVVFAHEARPYSLFVLMAVLSSVLLLRALRIQSKAGWVFYGLSLVFGLYTHVFLCFVAAAHALYVFTVNRALVSRTTLPYIAVSALALLVFVPWLLIMFGGSGPKGTSWTHEQQSFADCITRWAGIVSRAFVDFGVAPSDSLQAKLAVMPVIGIVLLFVAYSLYFLIRNAKFDEWFFVVTFTSSVALVLFLMDVSLGRRYGTTRYILASVVGLEIASAYLITSVMAKSERVSFGSRVVQAVGGLLIFLGGISCVHHAHAGMWWNKVPGKYGDYPVIAKLVNDAHDPLVLCTGPWRFTQMLCHELDPDVRICLVSRIPLDNMPVGSSDVFFFFPPEQDSDVGDQERKRVRDSAVAEQRVGDLWQFVTDSGRE